MAETQTTRFAFSKPNVGEETDAWGAIWNLNADEMDVRAGGYISFAINASTDTVLALATYTNPVINLTATLSANVNVEFPATEGWWMVKNGTTGDFTLTLKVTGGTGVEIATGDWCMVYSDGTNLDLIKLGVSAGGAGGTDFADAQEKLGAHLAHQWFT